MRYWPVIKAWLITNGRLLLILNTASARLHGLRYAMNEWAMGPGSWQILDPAQQMHLLRDKMHAAVLGPGGGAPGQWIHR
jgi:hypothetical protein